MAPDDCFVRVARKKKNSRRGGQGGALLGRVLESLTLVTGARLGGTTGPPRGSTTGTRSSTSTHALSADTAYFQRPRGC